MSYTKELMIRELSFLGLTAYYTGGLKIVTKERQQMGKTKTTYIPKLRRLHPIFLIVTILGLTMQGFNKGYFNDLKKLYISESVWF